MEPKQYAKESADEPPPFLGSWRRVYWCILCYLAVLISGLYVVSRAFSY